MSCLSLKTARRPLSLCLISSGKVKTGNLKTMTTLRTKYEQTAQQQPTPKPRAKRKPRAPKAAVAPQPQQQSLLGFLVKATILVAAFASGIVVYRYLDKSVATPEVATAAESAALVFKQKYLTGLSKLYSEGAAVEHSDLQDALEWLKPKKDELIKQAFVDMGAQLEQINGDSFTSEKKRQVFEGFSKGLLK